MSAEGTPVAAPSPSAGQLIVHGEGAEPKPRKRIKLLNRTPSPVILDDYGSIEPSRCTIGGPGIAGGIVGVPTQVTVTARDANGIAIREGGERFTMTFQHNSTGSVVREYQSTDRGDGSYAFLGIRADLKGLHKVCSSAG
jgi:Filamin/ABP280 repeat